MTTVSERALSLGGESRRVGSRVSENVCVYSVWCLDDIMQVVKWLSWSSFIYNLSTNPLFAIYAR